MVTRIVSKKIANQTGKTVRRAARVVQKNVTNAVSGTLGITGERMTKVDTAWLRMDSPSNLMMIVGVWILKPGVSYAAVCERIQDRFLKYPRFGQYVQQDAAGATWVGISTVTGAVPWVTAPA